MQRSSPDIRHRFSRLTPLPDPLGLARALEASGRFRRDTPLGAILHRGKLSFREVSSTDSLHVVIDGHRLSVHVDRVCPLSPRGGAGQYSWLRVLTHNLADVARVVGRRLRGRPAGHRCDLECELVWVDDEEAAEVAGCEDEGILPASGVLAPGRSAS